MSDEPPKTPRTTVVQTSDPMKARALQAICDAIELEWREEKDEGAECYLCGRLGAQWGYAFGEWVCQACVPFPFLLPCKCGHALHQHDWPTGGYGIVCAESECECEALRPEQDLSKHAFRRAIEAIKSSSVADDPHAKKKLQALANALQWFEPRWVEPVARFVDYEEVQRYIAMLRDVREAD